jgi:formylglycine-generating enzyme required for sulfatase activity
MDQFVGRWYTELECKQWIDAETARDLPGQLRSALRRDEIAHLARRPALMTLIAMLHTMHGQLPINRVACYDQLIDLYLTQWTEGRAPVRAFVGGDSARDRSADAPLPDETPGATRDLRQAFDLDALQATLAHLTYDRYARMDSASELVELSTGDLRAALINVVRGGRREAVDTLIARMRTRPALLDERQPDSHVYAHPCLQVHAVAYHLAQQTDLPQVALALAHEDYDRWHEVILLAGIRLSELGDNLPAALELADALCRPLAADSRQDTTPDVEWRLAWLTGEMLAEIAQEIEMPRPMHTLDCVESWLIALLEKGRLTPAERAKAGHVLDRMPLGDRRPGVSTANLLWCPVPAGDFWQGRDPAAQIAYVNTFWISRYPVTNAQYATFVQTTGQSSPSHWQGETPPPGTGNRPVVHVTWEQAKRYCAWYTSHLFAEPFLVCQSSRVEKLQRVPNSVSRDWIVRLPTNQEWEKAARGGLAIPSATDTPGPSYSAGPLELVDNPMPRRTYPWGNEWQLSSLGTKGDETRCNVSESGIGTTTPVGMYPDGSSPYGLMDMAGNVWEWCLDWADDDKRYKIRKGGAFRFTHDHAQCAAFDKAHPGLAWPHLGFRVVLGPPLSQETGRWSERPLAT